MASRDLEREIDKLYRLPLDEFTAKRNALAQAAGTDGAGVKALQKPPTAAWAVNQLYWQRRNLYDALIEAAETLRASHTAVLSGKSADLRAAGRDHETALEAALKAALGLLQESGHPATDATRQAIVTTLRALPADEPPGRLTRVLQPGGFEALAGIPLGPQTQNRDTRKGARPQARKPEPEAQDSKALAEARETATAAARDLKIAEQAARREEFEAARAAREADKAARTLEHARIELEAAQRAVDDADREAQAAADRRRETEARARGADAALSKARARVADAEARIAGLSGARRR